MAEGKPLSFAQEDLKIKGHSLEVRVYAEDPVNGFLPDIGKLQTYIRPQGPGIRVDDGFEQGMDIPIYYDPMIAKLITYGDDRQQAIDRMLRAIKEYRITGISTTLGFCAYVLKHDAFTSGQFDTKFVETYFDPAELTKKDPDKEKIAMAMAAYLLDEHQQKTTRPKNSGQMSKWKLRARS